MNTHRVLATSRRVLRQLRHDPRTVALMLVVPCVLMVLLRYVFDGHLPEFDRVAPMLLAILPFTVMFVVTSVAMLRERTSGTLERLLTTPMAKSDLLAGYAVAFGVVAVIQVGVVAAVTLGPLGVRSAGGTGVLLLVGVLDALLGTALGLFLSVFAHSEFEAVQFMPAFVLPQLVLCGLFAPRDQMAPVLRWLSDVLPLSYAVDGASRAASSPGWSASLIVDLVVVGACIPVALGLGALTLRRRTP
ncbi:MAG: ABC transporter permease [Actinomycetes bacterium]